MFHLFILLLRIYFFREKGKEVHTYVENCVTYGNFSFKLKGHIGYT